MKRGTAILRIFLHGFFLISVNLFSLIAAIVFLKLTDSAFDKVSQMIIALIINLIIYLLVYRLMGMIQKEIMTIDNFMMFAIILLISLALLPLVFYPLHFVTSGQWSSFDKIISTWGYQLLVNSLCLAINYFIQYKKEK